MKNDPTFKLVAAIIFAGVIVAFINPSPTAPEEGPIAVAPVTTTVHATE